MDSWSQIMDSRSQIFASWSQIIDSLSQIMASRGPPRLTSFGRSRSFHGRRWNGNASLARDRVDSASTPDPLTAESGSLERSQRSRPTRLRHEVSTT